MVQFLVRILTRMVARKAVLVTMIFFAPAAIAEDCVILLHGLASHPLVMKPMEIAIDVQPEFRVVNQGYNSYADEISVLAQTTIPLALDECDLREEETVSFVTHSMGGILLRTYLSEHEIRRLRSVVMLAPPNHGSEVVDWTQKYSILKPALGPAGNQLSTEGELLATLPEVDVEIGIIAGTRENRLFWQKILPGQNDGKVSTESAKMDRMSDYKEIEARHSALMFEKESIEQVLSFLRYGRFDVNSIDRR